MKKRKFKPKPGQVDYSNIHWAPVVNCAVKYKDKILLVRRSKGLGFYPGYWNGISGFLDDKKSVEEKVREELREELGISGKDIKKIKKGEIFHIKAPKYDKTWIVHPVLVEIKTDKVRLDWEAESLRWIEPKKAQNLKLVSDFKNVLKKLFPQIINSGEVKVGDYKHYKGDTYRVFGKAFHSETLEELVIYRHLSEKNKEDLIYWVRPVKMFLEKVAVKGKKIPRFKYIGKRNRSNLQNH